MTTTPTSGAADLPEARLFTKKPVTIAALQWTGKNLREVITFTDGPPDTRTTHAGMAWEAYADLVARDGLKIYTLEGKMLASPGDWIIRGVKGEYYPCKPDIFDATYSPAALAAGQATAAQQGAYAALPEPYCNAHDDADACYPDMFSEHQMRAFADATHALRTEQPAPADRIDLHQALTDPENQPNQYGVEFGMSGTHMHFKVGNQLFKLAYEPDEQEEFDFMKRMLVNAFTAFTHDVKTAPQPSPTAQAAQPDSVQEDAARYRWLRDQAHPDSEDSGIAVSESDFNDWGNKFTRYYSGEELDAAIDAAMNKGGAA